MAAHHVLIGGGPAATNAIETIRQMESERSQITLISDEPAHSRMALPYWLAGKIPREHTHTGDDGYFQKLAVDAKIGGRVTAIDPTAKTVALQDGSSLSFDNLLIATGSTPRTTPIPGADLTRVQPMWTLKDTADALQAVEQNPDPHVVMIGAGFIGFIVLNAMFKRKWRLTVIERESHVLPRMLNAQSAQMVEDWLAERKVQVFTGANVTGISEAGEQRQVEMENNDPVTADLVVMATGVTANMDLLDGSGVETDAGILVNERMQTNFPHIYAAGDVAQGPVLFKDQKEIHAIQPTAVEHGRIAGANMAGHDIRYSGSLLMNVVDVCGLQCASFGNWDDASAEKMTIESASGWVYRQLSWTGDQITGAIFVGRANDMGMLTDVGMVKGLMQTQISLGSWKKHLEENPFDIRRAYIASGAAQKLVKTTLLGRPTAARGFQFGGAKPETAVGSPHGVYVSTKT